ncbi:MAG: tripartite tricarboxylate transporter substrate binding protein [Rhodoferax sp.]|jgi:tripartite-type tricarboxylate transporter receptor subunit TctC|nr:tripartite tricarboxylate transporter substrate binding protein [Rhodoferax sp.]MBK7548180.1 tripartite tricarboxylate transporter substrate binding protein [Rhodoferax sp.]MBP7572871.1 tripartite tricarboxylate transporter substrate binding protein [Rhodoferax sp.]MBP8136004.1 tripartite tricarboxylate transporter substrate binding protein [Rhodoferax sp.]
MSTSPFQFTRRQTLAGVVAALATPLGAWAQSDKPVKFILPVSAGSGVDGIARAAQNALSKALGQPVVFENQPGAGGVVGTAAMIKSAPDGLTLSMVSNNHVIYPSVLKSVPFDPVADITPIAVIGATPLVLVVNPKVAATNMKELVALFKANPGKYNYASSGNGTILHLAPELFKDVTGTFSTHIPYRGFGPMLQDIVSGQVDWGVGALPAVMGQIKAGNVRAICVSAPARIAAAPDIPTSAEQGYPGYLVEGWIAVVGPKGLPADQVKRIHNAVATAFATAEVKEAMAKQGNTINISTPEFALAHFKSELVKYAGLVKKAGVVPQ